MQPMIMTFTRESKSGSLHLRRLFWVSSSESRCINYAWPSHQRLELESSAGGKAYGASSPISGLSPYITIHAKIKKLPSVQILITNFQRLGRKKYQQLWHVPLISEQQHWSPPLQKTDAHFRQRIRFDCITSLTPTMLFDRKQVRD